MTKMLASVNSVEEALVVLQENVDIIDLKQPALGALGALDIALVKAIVATINNRCPVSATIGDLPMQAQLIFNAVQTMAETGVEYIKIGFFPDNNWQTIIDKLSGLTQNNLALIAVLFADGQPDLSVIHALKNAGFTGVMLDTMDKKNGSLSQVMSKNTLQHFVHLAKNQQLLCGLAGSLTLQDIPDLLIYQPDYLGFRGALCEQHNRTSQLNRQSTKLIKQALARC
ncbi:Response regulator receiver protein (fragment) [Crenothrix polyspora]|uniref:(5-formylfuran-3-yl)methyl phosphate synthase n=1 Tax=Crenothrix polyspora TaxID=360316 RepID=A0A1R4HIB7_9GAMM